ncbi:hypothetical protein G3O06_13810 [Burkholderia sp. Ac-20345]|uniref:hypothetical protein n=1 Tax=Burkholderia sp. Ac-20345 TaxID=2703891 RepID=UPI00197C01C0|nr:hypothetical protein [Burkholderia sp. Ac-20345]MBN3778621.1 hypothetical protein [Burkholderia sp. Ac-20345]
MTDIFHITISVRASTSGEHATTRRTRRNHQRGQTSKKTRLPYRLGKARKREKDTLDGTVRAKPYSTIWVLSDHLVITPPTMPNRPYGHVNVLSGF